MKNQIDNVKYLPGEIVMKILARLPVQSIVRLKLVCRVWKSFAESTFFRNLYQSNDWSILHGNVLVKDSCLEKVKLQLPHDDDGHDACLSFASFFTKNKDMINKDIRVVACVDGLVLLRLTSDEIPCYYIGNPVLSQWIQLPPPSPYPFLPSKIAFNDLGLVTRMHNGSLESYKVIRNRDWCFDIFSSDTGEWNVTGILDHLDLRGFMPSNIVSLNGKIFWLGINDIIVYDFYSTIRLPSPRIQGTYRRRFHVKDCCKPSPCQKNILTTSQGYCVFADVELINRTDGYNVRIWRLKNDCLKWEMASDINMVSVGFGSMCVPLAINFFDIHIIYLWDLDRRCCVAYNLRTHSKTYGTCKGDAAVVGMFYHKDTAFPKSSPRYRYGYKDNADRLCFSPRSCVSQFVPTFHVVPT